jgi:hypothetical protein
MSKAQCLDCEDILESKHRHDFVKCRCGNAFLDGGDDYIRGGGNLAIWEDEQFMPVLQRDSDLEKCLQDVIIDDMFNDDSFLDDDFDDYNLGYQAGTMDERERILEAVQKLEDQSHATRTPLYQETMFTKIRKIVNGAN